MTTSTQQAPAAPGPRSSAGSVPRITIPMHGLTRYLRVRLGVVDGVLRWELPRTLLGIVPLGSTRLVEVPVADVRSQRVHRVVRPVPFLLGLVAVASPAYLPWWGAVPVVLVGLAVILIAVGPRLEAQTVDGRALRANVCFGHQIDAELYMRAVADLAERSHRATGPGTTPSP